MGSHRRQKVRIRRAVEPAIGDHHAEGRQHRKVARETLAADRIEDQIDSSPSGHLIHGGDDIFAAVVDLPCWAPRASAARRFASDPATPITFIPAISAKFTAALSTYCVDEHRFRRDP